MLDFKNNDISDNYATKKKKKQWRIILKLILKVFFAVFSINWLLVGKQLSFNKSNNNSLCSCLTYTRSKVLFSKMGFFVLKNCKENCLREVIRNLMEKKFCCSSKTFFLRYFLKTISDEETHFCVNNNYYN